NNITQRNRNGLLRMNVGVDGLKTGYIESAGYHLVATAQREGRRLIVVVMGAQSPKIREAEALSLLNYGFRNFTLKKIAEKGKTVKILPIKGGKCEQLELIAQNDLFFTVAAKSKDSLQVIENVPPYLVAPIEKGKVVGQLKVELGGKTLGEVNLLAKNDVPKGWQQYAKVGGMILDGIIGFLFIWLVGGRWKRKPKL
ncbi:MAG: hypothetical protein N3A64_04960, partial [Desulfobacterota bacterium]|nr:hypothetical protein [Thermodesulfobacteriota bacterium]